MLVSDTFVWKKEKNMGEKLYLYLCNEKLLKIVWILFRVW